MVQHFEQRRRRSRCLSRSVSGIGEFHRETRGGRRAFAAFLLVFDVAGRFGALELALRARAGRRLGTRPRARRLFAERRAVRLRSYTRRVALSRCANSLALGARRFLAHVLRAAHAALGLFAVNCAFGAGRLLALHFTFRPRTDRVTDRRARRVIALPAALRVAVLLGFGSFLCVDLDIDLRLSLSLGLGRMRHSGHRQQA